MFAGGVVPRAACRAAGREDHKTRQSPTRWCVLRLSGWMHGWEGGSLRVESAYEGGGGVPGHNSPQRPVARPRRLPAQAKRARERHPRRQTSPRKKADTGRVGRVGRRGCTSSSSGGLVLLTATSRGCRREEDLDGDDGSRARQCVVRVFGRAENTHLNNTSTVLCHTGDVRPHSRQRARDRGCHTLLLI